MVCSLRSAFGVGGCPCSVGCPSPTSWTRPRTEWRSSSCEEFFLRGVLPAPTAVPSAPNHPAAAAGRPWLRPGHPDPVRAADTRSHRLLRRLRDPPQGRCGGRKHPLPRSLAGLSPAQGSDQLLAADPLPCRRRCGHQPDPLLGPRSSGTLVPGYVPGRPPSCGAHVPQTDATGAVLQEPASCCDTGTASNASGWTGAP